MAKQVFILIRFSLVLGAFMAWWLPSTMAQSNRFQQLGVESSGSGRIQAVRCRHPRAVQSPNGTIYVLGSSKSVDWGRSFVPVDNSDPDFSAELHAERMTSILWRKGLFLGFYWNVFCEQNGSCIGKMWRSRDGLKSIEKTQTKIILPEAGNVPRDDFSEVRDQGSSSIYFHRGLTEMPDGSLLACMIGSFEEDTSFATNDPRSRMETPFKMRAFLIKSIDQGSTWKYVSTVAAPSADPQDTSEGFNEWALLPLKNGRLLAVMRTGHYTPMMAAWSIDAGKTWSEPANMDLGPGVDPYLLKMQDGRLALAYGQLVQRTGIKKADWRDEDQRRRCQLAINSDGSGESWVATTVADYDYRMAYPTIFEPEPNVILYQSGECMELWRVQVKPQ